MRSAAIRQTRGGKGKTAAAAAFALVLLLGLLAGSRPAAAFWGFTAQFYNNCPVNISLPSLPAITGFPDQASCQSVLALVQSDKQSVSYACGNSTCTCSMGFTTTPCTGSDSTFGSGGFSASASGLGPGSGGGPFNTLPNSLNAVNPLGTDAGQPFFSQHYDQNSQNWQSEANVRYSRFRNISGQPVPLSSVAFEHRFQNQLRRRCGDPGCLSYGGGAGFNLIRTLGPTYSQPDQPPRTTGDNAGGGGAGAGAGGSGAGGSPIGIDEGKAQSIGGAGVTQGPPDKAPPPTPYRTNPGEACHKSWWFNTATHMCYGSQPSCAGDVSAGPHQCYQQQ